MRVFFDFYDCSGYSDYSDGEKSIMYQIPE